MDLRHIPVVDNHAHALTHVQPATPEELRAHFTEAHAPEVARDHVPSAVYYRWGIRQIATALRCQPSEAAILERRAAQPFATHARDLVRRAGIACLLLDEGYPPPGEGYTTAELGAMLGVEVHPILRLETFAADLILRHAAFEEVLAAFDAAVSSARARGYVALKSIACYRTGLAIEPVDGERAEAAFHAVRAGAVQRGSLRLADKPLIDCFLWRAVRHAAAQRLPVQFHTGYGDPDLDLRLANPLHLRPLFEDPDLRPAPIVLLHASFPYVAEAAYLAAVYPNAYLDLPFSLPPLDALTLHRVVETALGVAPAGKLMVSSDGTRIPEHYYLGATRARAILARVLDAMVEAGELNAAEAEATAGLVLHDTAVRLYRLDGA